MYIIIIKTFLALLFGSGKSYKAHKALNSVIFTNVELPSADIHSEYFFGQCASRDKRLVAKHVYKYEDVKNKLILRSYLGVKKEPTCVYLRAKSDYSSLVRYHAFKFNICVCRLDYNYGGVERNGLYTYFYYEWFIPVEMMKEITWELYFYNN